jgi:serine/threonine-protein kinase
MIGRVIDRFRVVAKLGQGGMGSVWKAEDTLLRRPVALKVLSDELLGSADARRRFLREARAAAALNHPGVAAVFGAGESEDLVYIALALIDGETVTECATRQPFALDDVVRLALAAGEALGHAHSRGVIHRDVTGRNIMIARDGRVFVLDFGLALVIDQSRLTQHQVSMGTAAYMAPEAALGLEADPRTDLYGLGVVIYEAATGTVPFRHPRAEAMLYAAVHDAPEPPSARRPDLPPWVDEILLKALAKRPEDRFADLEAWTAAWKAHADAAESRVSHRWLQLEPAASPDRVHGQALAVEPFRDLSGTSGDALLAQGLSEALRAALSSAPGLEVVPLTGSETESDELRAERARRSGARRLLSGSLRRIGDRVRLSFALTDLATRAQVAGGNLDGQIADLFDLEDRVVTEVLAALRMAPSRAVTMQVPRDADAHQHYLTAVARLQSPDDEEAVDTAIATLEMLRATQPAAASVEAALGRAYLKKYQRRSGRDHELAAAEACQRALTLDPHAADVLITLGDLHRSTGRAVEAIETYRHALSVRPESFEAWIGLAFASMEAGSHDEAEEACRKAIVLRPDHPHGYQRLGLLFYRQGRHAQAVEPLKMVIRLDADNLLAHTNLAAALYQLGRLDEAADGFRRSLAIKETAAAWGNLGTVLFDQRRYADAVEAFEHAVRLKPTEARHWRGLASASELAPGGAARQRESLERAASLLTERLEINPHSVEDWTQLAAAAADLGQRERATAAIERGLELAPDDPWALAMAGQVWSVLGDRDAARRDLIDAVRRGFVPRQLLRNPAFSWLEADPDFQRALTDMSHDSDPCRPTHS